MTRCLICGKIRQDYRLRELFLGDEPLCLHCSLPPSPKRFRFQGYSMRTFYQYRDIQNVLLTYNRGDDVLAPIFLAPFCSFLRFRYRNYVIIPVPSHRFHDQERGFNPVELAFSPLGLSFQKILQKTKPQRQGSQQGRGRSLIAGSLAIKPGVHLSPRKRYLLVDDIYTTGATLRSCLKLLQGAGAQKIVILVIANHH